MCLNILKSFFLQGFSSENIDFLFKYPIEAIGSIILALGFIATGRVFTKWLEKTIEDDFFGIAVIIISYAALGLLFFGILYKMFPYLV